MAQLEVLTAKHSMDLGSNPERTFLLPLTAKKHKCKVLEQKRSDFTMLNYSSRILIGLRYDKMFWLSLGSEITINQLIDSSLR